MPADAFIDAAYLLFAFVSLFMGFLFLMLYARNRGNLRTVPVLARLPSISILVPAYNEEKAIEGTLDALRGLDYPQDKLQLIVIDDGSTDRTADAVRRFAGVRLLIKPNGGKASALNFGLKEATGEFVACVDSDSRPAPDALRKAIPFFADPKVAAVTTSIFVREPKNLIQRLQRIEYIMIVWARKLLEFLDSVYATPGPLSIYRASALRQVGGFDEMNLTEDIEIAWRLMHAGYSIRMAIDAEVDTSAPSTFRNWWRQRLRWNIGGMQTTLKYRHDLFKRGFGALGTFVIPFFSASYFLSMFGLFVFSYIILKSLSDFTLFSLAAMGAGASPLHYEFLLLPNVFTIFGAMIFLLSVAWVAITLKTVRRSVGGLKRLPDLLLYLAAYITLFPLNLLQASFRFLMRRDQGWARYSSVA
jgi:cellulose synthase/poly-beta-1,6-N-acetylglucosamine synthase-like glycosyltransferase